METKQEHSFAKEDRYMVLKRKDIVAALTDEEQSVLSRLADKVATVRDTTGRGTLSCVVVEDDWPETPVIWSMIEARMTGGVDFVQWQAARIVELEAELLAARRHHVSV